MKPELVLVPAPLDFGCAPAPLDVALPHAAQVSAASLVCWICENAKTARAYLKRLYGAHAPPLPLQQQQLLELPHAVHKKGDHQPGQWDARPLLQSALAHSSRVGLLCEAGIPAIADPGAAVVRAAHDMGWTVTPLCGPSSLMLALSASGLNGQNFAFQGYLPSADAARAERIRALQDLSQRSGQTQIFIETPYRNLNLWSALLQHLHGNTRLACASALTLAQQRCTSAAVARWREQAPPLDNNAPAVFLFGP